MKKMITVLLCAVLIMGALSGCGADMNLADDGKVSIITTIFPIYDWVNEILGDEAEDVDLTLLIDSGVDLHNFQITANDIIKISSCDMFIYAGGESDRWVEDTLSEVQNKDMVVINLLDVLGENAKEEEVVEGMQGELEDEEDHRHEGGGTEYDEHVWLSLKNASFFCRYISERLGEIDTDHTEVYAANAAAYIEKLNSLDKEYQTAVDNAARDTILFGDRFPFRYLVDDYGLNYYAAFVGCSAETEASFETITFLAGKVDELELSVILQIESSDGSIPNTIRDSSTAKDQTILTMDSMQSAAAVDIKNGVTYLSVMEGNLDILKQALEE